MSRVAHIRRDIAAIEQQLCSIEAEKQQAREALDVLSAKRRLLEARRTALDAQATPVHWLPSELLLDIFVAFLQADASAPVTLELLVRPITVSLVCRQWRSLALSTSSLWFRIPVHTRPMILFLSRSQETMLELAFLQTPVFDVSSWDATHLSLRPYVPRVRSIRWRMTGGKSRDMLNKLMTSDVPLCALQVIDICGPAQQRRLQFWAVERYVWMNNTTLPALEELRLTAAMALSKPPVRFPRLRILQLDHRDLRLSVLYQLLQCTPNLKTLVLVDIVPRLDFAIRSIPARLGDRPRIQWAWASTSQPRIYRDVPVLACLEHLDWSFAPPADAWLLFLLLDTPNLRSLALCLNTGLSRWPRYTGYDPSNPDPAIQDSIPVCLSSLRELDVQCIDDEALRYVFHKLHFPSLTKLHITYLPPLRARCELPRLPRHESMFREPRLHTVTDLKLSHFTLDIDETKTMLRYMPALTHLTFLDCPQAAGVVCALSGGTCDNRHVNPLNIWICPRLEVFRVVDVPDLRFRCLRGMLHARFHGSRAPGSCLTTPSKQGPRVPGSSSPRVVKPLRRRLRDDDLSSADGSTSSPSSRAGATIGWNPYASMRPSLLRIVCVEGCRRVSEVEAMSLGDEFPSLRVKWEA